MAVLVAGYKGRGCMDKWMSSFVHGWIEYEWMTGCDGIG